MVPKGLITYHQINGKSHHLETKQKSYDNNNPKKPKQNNTRENKIKELKKPSKQIFAFFFFKKKNF